MNNLYLVHQYWEPGHFRALYECAERYGFTIKRYIILDNGAIILKAARILKYERKPVRAVVDLVKNFTGKILLRFIKKQYMIVGLAPYDNLMLTYNRVFQNNYSIYFTSWICWDGSHFPRGKSENREAFEAVLQNSFQGVACVNQVSYRQMKTWFTHAAVVGHSVKTKLFVHRSDYEKKNIQYVFVGSFDERKNVPLILEYWDTCKDVNIEISFIGDGPLRDKIIEQAVWDRRVHYLGKWNQEQLQKHLCEFHFLILPSIEEPYGIVLLEAFAAGIPCIVSNADGPKEIVMDGVNGFIFDLSIKERFLGAMQRSILLSVEEYKEMCDHALAESKRYDCEAACAKWMEILIKK